MSSQIQGLFMTMRLWDVLDILVVAFFLYRIYILIRDTRATALLKGLVFLGLFTVLAGWLQLHVVSWILDKLMTVLIVALPVVFQPELRRALEQMGFSVLPSRTNFLFATKDGASMRELFLYLKQRHIYIRYFDLPRIDNYVRITIGTDAQMDAFLQGTEAFLRGE